MKSDEIDIERIMRAYGDSMLRMSFLYLKDVYLAEDAVQDTLIKVYRHYPDFQKRSTEKTWVMRILISVCKNYLRINWWRRIDPRAALEMVKAEEEYREDDLLLHQVMALPTKYKEVILLYYYGSGDRGLYSI